MSLDALQSVVGEIGDLLSAAAALVDVSKALLTATSA